MKHKVGGRSGLGSHVALDTFGDGSVKVLGETLLFPPPAGTRARESTEYGKPCWLRVRPDTGAADLYWRSGPLREGTAARAAACEPTPFPVNVQRSCQATYRHISTTGPCNTC